MKVIPFFVGFVIFADVNFNLVHNFLSVLRTMIKPYQQCFSVALMFFIFGFLSGCTEAPPKIPPFQVFPMQVSQNQEVLKEYKFDVGDVLDIKFYYYQDLSDSATVRPDGKITLQLVGDIMAKGVTPKELEQNINQKYTGILRHPNVAVIARKFVSKKIFVGGEVSTPGVIPLEGHLTALQAIISVGGFKNSAQVDNIVILKNDGNRGASYQIIDLKKHLTHEKIEDIELSSNDVVFVPKMRISEISTFFKENINEIFPFYKNSGITFPFMYYLNPGAVQTNSAPTR